MSLSQGRQKKAEYSKCRHEQSQEISFSANCLTIAKHAKTKLPQQAMCAVLVYCKSFLHPVQIAPVARVTNTDDSVQGRTRPELWTLNCPRTKVGPSLPVFETAWQCGVHLPEPHCLLRRATPDPLQLVHVQEFKAFCGWKKADES